MESFDPRRARLKTHPLRGTEKRLERNRGKDQSARGKSKELPRARTTNSEEKERIIYNGREIPNQNHSENAKTLEESTGRARGPDYNEPSAKKRNSGRKGEPLGWEKQEQKTQH